MDMYISSVEYKHVLHTFSFIQFYRYCYVSRRSERLVLTPRNTRDLFLVTKHWVAVNLSLIEISIYELYFLPGHLKTTEFLHAL